LARLILTRQELIAILRVHGFTLKRQVGSHQQWEATVSGRRRLVTVDASVREFSGWLLNRMIHQSGLPKFAFLPSS
jgi:predicted RNA binding protein YcfA (HicA-like mRNA interferase family)